MTLSFFPSYGVSVSIFIRVLVFLSRLFSFLFSLQLSLCHCTFLSHFHSDSFSVCFTLSVRLPLFIFVTQSFLRSLFPCLTHLLYFNLSFFFSLSGYSPTLFFCLHVQIFLFVCVLHSLSLSLSSYLSDSSLYLSSFRSVRVFLSPPFSKHLSFIYTSRSLSLSRCLCSEVTPNMGANPLRPFLSIILLTLCTT